jgi:hypothetical protein
MRKTMLALGSAFAVLTLFASSAVAAPELRTFGTGEVTLEGNDATIVIDTGEFGGVFERGRGQGGEALDDVVFSFTSSGDVAGGSPRFSIPIDTDDPGNSVNAFAFIDAAGCGATVGDNPTNVATLVSTTSTTCSVNFDGDDFANWDAFAEANPDFRVALGQVAFIIADTVPPGFTSGTYEISNIVL